MRIVFCCSRVKEKLISKAVEATACRPFFREAEKFAKRWGTTNFSGKVFIEFTQFLQSGNIHCSNHAKGSLSDLFCSFLKDLQLTFSWNENTNVVPNSALNLFKGFLPGPKKLLFFYFILRVLKAFFFNIA